MRIDLVIAAAVFTSVAAWWILKQLRFRSAQGWPRAEARFETADVVELRPTWFNHHRRGFECSLHYVYEVEGEVFSGEFSQTLPSEDLASRLAQEQKGRTVAIHYNRNSPSTSFLDQADAERLNWSVVILLTDVLAR